MTLKGLNFLPIDECQLQKNRIDVWQFSLDEQPIGAMGLLNEEEQTRATRFIFERHQRRFTVARATLRTILATYLHTEPNSLTILYNHYGKPYIDSSTQIEFNLSHSGELALLAVGQSYPLGIDLEFFSARPYAGIAATLFSKTELTEFGKQPESLQPFRFFDIWAQKEAFIKACGMGLSYPTQDFSVPPLFATDNSIIDSLHNLCWKIKPFMPKIACAAALCYNPAVTTLRKTIIDPSTMLNRQKRIWFGFNHETL